jgi:hypothetical protein
MAPLPRLAFLLLAAAPALAQNQYGPDDSAKTRASQAEIQKAGIPIYTLIDGSDQGMQWSAQNVADFGPAIEAASKAVAKLHAQYPSAVADAYGNGAMTNLEDTFKLFGGGNLERGCISHQSVTFDAVKPVLAGTSLVVRKVRELSTGAFPHNAVIVFPQPSEEVAADPKKLEAHWRRSGVVFDGWKRQKSDPDKMTYLFKDWYGYVDLHVHLIGDDE